MKYLSFNKFENWLALLLLLIFMTVLPAYGLNNKSIKAEADYIAFSPDKTIFVASGNAKVSLEKFGIQGGTICVDITNDRLVASNQVVLISENGEEMLCDCISINLKDKSGYVITDGEEKIKIHLNAPSLQLSQTIESFPEDSFYIENILDSELCITGNELVIHPNETAQIRPASFWINGSHSMELPFYSFSIGAGSSYIRPRVAYTNLGATADIPVILSLERDSMSIGHLKYNPDVGASFSLEHQMRFSDDISTVFYLEDLNKDDYRRARMVYRQQLSPTTDANLNVNWQNDKDLDMYFNLSHRFSHSNFTFNITAEHAAGGRESLPTEWKLRWTQNPTPLFNSPLLYSFSGGVNMSGMYGRDEKIWNRTVGLRLTHKPIKLGETSSFVVAVGDDYSWITGEERNYLYGNMTLRLGSRISLDSNIGVYSSLFDEGRTYGNTTGSISLNTRFTDTFSGRFSYSFNHYENLEGYYNYYGYTLTEDFYDSFVSDELGAFFTYNRSQNFQLGLGATYDLNLSRIRTAQGNMRIRLGNYFFLTLHPYYDFVNNYSNFNFQIDPVLIK